MRMSIRIPALVALFLAALCAPRPAEAAQGAGAAEIILGFMVDETAITYRVQSNGCTGKRDFSVRVLATNPRHLDLVRIHPDPCEAPLPFGIDVTFTWSELGLVAGDRWEVGNRVVSIMQAAGREATDGVIVGAPPVGIPSSEIVLGFKVDPEGITYRVAGCATRGDFRVETMSTFPAHVLLLRTAKSTCGGASIAPWFTDLFFGWKDLGLKPGARFELGNQIKREGILRYF